MQCVGSLNALWSIIEHKAKNMRYWEGSKHNLKSLEAKLKCNCKAVHSTPIKPGVRRRLSVKSELVLVLMNSDFVFLMPSLLGRDADLVCLAQDLSAIAMETRLPYNHVICHYRFYSLDRWHKQWLVDDVHCTCNVNIRKLLSANKSHVREISLFIGTIPNQVRNSQTSRFVVGSKSGKVKPRRQRGATVVTGGGNRSRIGIGQLEEFSLQSLVEISGGECKRRIGLVRRWVRRMTWLGSCHSLLPSII